MKGERRKEREKGERGREGGKKFLDIKAVMTEIEKKSVGGLEI